MFNPALVDHLECFRILNPETIDALSIKGPYKRRYSYNEIYPALDKCERIVFSISKKATSDLLPFEREMLGLWNNITEYIALSSALSAFDPSENFTINDTVLASTLGLQVHQPYAYSELIGLSQKLSSQFSNINNQDSLVGTDAEVVRLVRSMYAASTQMQNAPPFIIPVVENGNEEWLSIWGYLNKFGTRGLKNNRIVALQKLRTAFLTHNQSNFNEVAITLNSEKFKDAHHPDLEILYNKINLFFWAKIVLVLATLLTLFSIFYNKSIISKTGFILIIAGFILQTAGLLLRVLILMRPPLASLYETFVFVSWIIVLLGTGLEILQKKNIGKLIASCGGLAFLIISDRYVTNGDSFGVIAAVLNSGFWLTIHIVTIAIGYAGCLISGLIGHIYLLQRVFGVNEKTTRPFFQTVYMFLLIGLAFTVAGTVLGGMWADQAWGRFWGWDPKENGALLIILWGSAVVHAYRGKLISQNLTAAGAILGIPTVMLTWIGVNLLGVGLHSYGFTYSGAGMLVAVFSFEILFLVTVGILNKIQKSSRDQQSGKPGKSGILQIRKVENRLQ